MLLAHHMSGKRIVVTGANGHIGNNLVRELLNKGYSVVATVRDSAKGEPLKEYKNSENLIIEVADVLSSESWQQIMQGADGLIHTATVYSTTGDAQVILDTANIGVENVFRAAAAAGIKRIVHTSSTAAVGSTPKGVIKDHTFWHDGVREPYSRAKTESERLAWSLAEELDLDLRVINPSAILGGNFFRQTPSVDFFEDAIQGKYPFSLKIPFPCVHVDDVVNAHIVAFENDDASGRYILAPHTTYTIADIMRRIKQLYPQTKSPKRALPNRLVPLAVFQDWIGGIFGKPRTLTRRVVKGFFKGDSLYDSSRAENELGLVWKDFDTCIKDTVEAVL